jgi:hypothetical protein
MSKKNNKPALEAPIQPMQQEQKNMSLKEMLFELGNQLDQIKGTYTNIIIQQDAAIQKLNKEIKKK